MANSNPRLSDEPPATPGDTEWEPGDDLSGSALRAFNGEANESGFDDAYVRADWVALSPRVAGYVAEVAVADDQPVKAGDVLVRLQSRDYRARLDQARAGVAEAQATLVAAQARP